MTDKTYHLSIEVQDENPETQYMASAYGSLDVVNYVARAAVKAMHDTTSDQFSVALVEVAGILGDEKRTIVDITGDAEICALVLNKRLRGERATAAAATAE